MEVNILGLIATALFIIIPTAFLLILYRKNCKPTTKINAFFQDSFFLVN